MFSFASGWGSSSSKTSTPPATNAEALKEKVKEWQKELKHEMRNVDKGIREIQRDVDKLKAEAQVLIKKGDVTNAKTLCKHVVRAKATISQMEVTKAQLNSLSMQLGEQAATVKVASVLGKSTSIMKTMGVLVRGDAIAGTIRKLGAEMQSMGIISEIMSDAMDAAAPVDEEEEVDELVEQVVWEVTRGQMGKAPPSVIGKGVQQTAPAAATETRQAVAMGGAGGPG